jgi:hypothetical protein
MVIFSLFYKFDGQLKPMGMGAGVIFSPDYFDVDQIFGSPLDPLPSLYQRQEGSDQDETVCEFMCVA